VGGQSRAAVERVVEDAHPVVGEGESFVGGAATGAAKRFCCEQPPPEAVFLAEVRSEEHCGEQFVRGRRGRVVHHDGHNTVTIKERRGHPPPSRNAPVYQARWKARATLWPPKP